MDRLWVLKERVGKRCSRPTHSPLPSYPPPTAPLLNTPILLQGAQRKSLPIPCPAHPSPPLKKDHNDPPSPKVRRSPQALHTTLDAL